MISTKKVDSQESTATEQQKTADLMRRKLWDKPFWFPLNRVPSLLINDLGLTSVVAIRWMYRFTSKAEKVWREEHTINGVKKTCFVDLAETRWESQATIAKAITVKRSEVSPRNVKYVESILKKEKLIRVLVDQVGSKQRIRYFSFSALFFDIAKSSLHIHPIIPKPSSNVRTKKTPKGVVQNVDHGVVQSLVGGGTQSGPLDNNHLEYNHPSSSQEQEGSVKNPKGQASAKASPPQGTVRSLKPAPSPRPNTSTQKKAKPTEGKLRPMKVKHDIEVYLFTKKTDSVDWKSMYQNYVTISEELNLNQYAKLIGILRKYFKESTAFTQYISSREMNWDEFFVDLIGQAKG